MRELRFPGRGANRWARRVGPVALALWVAVAGSAVPVSAQLPTIQEIRVEGNQRIEAETVRSYMLVREGDFFDLQQIDRSLKSLFATGLFADVNLRREGNVLVVRIVENPIINRLAFEGNKRIDEDVLAAEVQLRPRVVYTRTKVKNDVARILEVYRRSGRFAATVEPKVIRQPDNRVDLVFEIDEGRPTRIRKIIFIGNRRFSDSKLKGVILTKESRWYRIFTSDDTYDPDRLAFDEDLLWRFYLSKGYADFRVRSVVAELTRDRLDFFTTFTIEEGERYRFGETDIDSRLRELDVSELFAFVKTVPGKWYNADLVEETIEELTDEIGSLGFAFVDIQPVASRDRENRTIGITYEIAEGPRVYVERINIAGNVRTLDKVIRREFQLAEGDAFNTAKIRRSRRRIRNLGFFDTVDVTTRRGSSPDKTSIDVEVRERSTGALTFGAGVSSVEGLVGDISVSERNLLGQGQQLSLALTLSTRRQAIDLSFTEPYFLNRQLSAGFDVFRRVLNRQQESSFDSEQLGFSLRVGYPLVEAVNQRVSYTLRRDEITDVGEGAAIAIQEQEGSSVTSAVGHMILFDRRDNRFDPSEGFFVSFDQDLAGLGGSVRYLRNQLFGAQYFPFGEQFVGSLSLHGGIIFGLGEDIRLTDRFFLGGGRLRGFDDRAGVGPRDRVTRDALGGKTSWTGTAELSFPIGLPTELGMRGRVFTDVGSLFDTDSTGPTVFDASSVRASVGFGLTYVSPLGPIRLDFAEAVLKEDLDETQAFHFNIGTNF